MLARQTILLAQLVAQYLDLGKFNKEDHYVDQNNQDALLLVVLALYWCGVRRITANKVPLSAR